MLQLKNTFLLKKGSSEFLKLFQTWWTISKSKFSNIRLGNAARIGDGKPGFLIHFAACIKTRQDIRIPNSERFTLSKQTMKALIMTMNSNASLIEDLLNEGYDFALTSRFQSDPLEKIF